MKPCLLFDLDGTLTDPGIGITNSVMYALSTYGIRETNREKLYPFIGPPLVDSFQRYYGFPREKGLEATRRFQEYFSRKGLYENQVYPGIPALLECLCQKGMKLVLATSKPEEFAIRILRHFSLEGYFSLVCGATMDEKTRSEKKDVIAYALEKGSILPQEAVMIGDRKYDIAAAKALGLKAVGVLYGYGSREELEQAGASVVCASVEDLEKELLK